MYPFDAGCIPCEPGYMCPIGLRVQCPKHYYQPAAGATSCMLCASSGDDGGFFKCDRKGYMLPFCDPARAGSQISNPLSLCISCNRCRRAYASYLDPIMQDCYRDD
jgi:hypothetical protein